MTMTLFASCVLPGCDTAVLVPGLPCDGCLTELSGYLAPSNRPRPTAEQIAERDESVRAINRSRYQPERRANQLCWICDERHTCTRERAGWECDTCRDIA